MLSNTLNNHLIDYPTPLNFNYWWGFGAMSSLCLAIQIASGIFLAMHYVPHVDYAFSSVEHIMRDVENGWLIRYFHSNGASLFFFSVYLHMCRSLYYGSYLNPRQYVWSSGVAILVLMMATAFIGYVLPWGQMSFWGATVITSIFSAIPLIGPSIVEWLWGGFSVDNATLNRFFSLHYLLPFAIAGVVVLHIALLHEHGSNNPLGIESKIDNIAFDPYYTIKDLIGFNILGLIFTFFVFFYPNVLGHPDNYIPADPILTPAHIVPEWYFLPFYAILRSVPSKLGGVILMGASLVMLVILPLLNGSSVRSSYFRPAHTLMFWGFLVNCLLLGWVGQKVVEYPYQEIGVVTTTLYFAYFFLVWLKRQ